MSDQLVTLATFNTPTEARLARNHLESEGIRVFLADEATIGMAWHLGTALGGIKLQVAERDAERAFTILETIDSAALLDDEFQAPEFTGEDDEPESDDEQVQANSPVDELASRAFRAALFGFLFFPLHFYSFFLLIRIAILNYPLNARNRRQVMIAFVLDLPMCLLYLAFVKGLL